MPQSSRFWPYLRVIARALTVKVPFTEVQIGPGLLADIQDKLDEDESERQLFAAINAIRDSASEISELLRTEAIEASPQEIAEIDLVLAEALYRKQVADKYLYVDFHGIMQMERFVSLRLDDIFINLRVVPEHPTDQKAIVDGDRTMVEIAGVLVPAEVAEQQLADDAFFQPPARDAEPLPIDASLREREAIVLLGGPGTGKTTLLKRLARAAALGSDAEAPLFRELPHLFPVLLPVSLFDDLAGPRDLFDYLRDRMREVGGGDALVRAFTEHWAAGQCLVLLDGLDEIADAGRRVHCSRAVGNLMQSPGGADEQLEVRKLLPCDLPPRGEVRLAIPAGTFRTVPSPGSEMVAALYVAPNELRPTPPESAEVVVELQPR
ncbi:MAG: NACHT domain-containing protein [Planctomycetaceae bacterium]|nr:NACHT domain-containing protein [Planctomycetaceae bacterium]